MKNKKTMSKLMIAIWVVQLLAEALTFGIIWRLNMLPVKYLLIVAALFVIMLLVTGALLLVRGKRRRRSLLMRDRLPHWYWPLWWFWAVL